MIYLNADKNTTLIWQLVEQLQVFEEFTSIYSKEYNPADFVKFEISESKNGIQCFRYDEVDKIMSCDKNIIFVDLLTEGIYSTTNQKILEKFNRDKKYVLFSNGLWEKDKFNLPFEYDLINYNYHWVDWVVRQLQPWHLNFYLTESYKQEIKKTNEFSCIIGSKKYWRDYLVQELLKLSFDNYILNYSGKDLKVPNEHLNINYDFKHYNTYQAFDSNNIFSIAMSVPVTILNTTKYNLIVETDSETNHSWHMTEKTLKIFSIGMPWVAFSSQHYLKYLHSLGFMSYSSLWSEEYDSIENPTERIHKIIELINNLTNFDWDANRDQLDFIANHNRKNLYINYRHVIKDQLKYFNTAMLNLEKQLR